MAAIEEHKPAEKRRALGRGLDSLLPSGPRVVTSPPVVPPPVVVGSAAPAIVPAPTETAPVPADVAELHPARESSSRTGVSAPHGQEIQEIPLELIDENPYQTRKTFDEAALNELAESIKANGLAQPVVVRPGANGRYVLVLGERRCRASKLAGKTSVPAIVRELGNEQAAEMTVVENLQRQDLNCLEQAQAFARLSREFNLTQEQIGKRTGTSRESVANYMRLLKLPKGVLDLVGEGRLGFSEARVLLEAAAYLDTEGLEKMARDAVDLGWTVRDLTAKVKQLQNPDAFKTEARPEKAIDPNVRAAQMELERLLGTRVRINDHQGKGKIVIEYRNLSDFDRVLELLQAN
ncbi:MAG TPA: ParB/RepB/Spo0J family partition protein [Terriglobales bacterium]|nr:ParB/RepB/Spo0J family partition protein [Terriglobales bacterium]